MQVGHASIGQNDLPFVIAELSGNHGGSLDRALATVDAMAGAGATAIKLQTYTADTMTLDVDRSEFTITNPESPWFGRRLYELYEEAHTPWDWHAPIMNRAAELGLLCFSSPFDDSAVDFLDELGVPAFKIASFECVDLPLIRRAASTGKPLIISTGMATLDEIDAAVDAARSSGCRELALLKCTSTYPADPSNSNLRAIVTLKERYGCEVGLSDHTLGFGAAVAAVALGATVIEKHVTLDRLVDTVDGSFSLVPAEFEVLVEEVHTAHRALGRADVGPTEAELPARSRRRSLYIGRDLARGHVLTEEDIVRVRPGGGLPPKEIDAVMGLVLAKDATRGTPLTWDLFDATT